VAGAATVQPPLYHPRHTSPPFSPTRGKLWTSKGPWSASFWVLRGGEGGEKQGNNTFFFPYFLRVQGKKKGYSVIQNDTVLGFFLFSFFF
jgi:hypothetical protein